MQTLRAAAANQVMNAYDNSVRGTGLRSGVSLDPHA